MEETPIATVLEHSQIQPLSDNSIYILPLIHFDIPFLTSDHTQRLLFFKFPCTKAFFVESVVPSLKKSLQLTLNHFLPLAGKIILSDSDRPPESRYIVGDSVSFTIAECMGDLDRLAGNHFRVADEFYACVPHLEPARRRLLDDFVATFPVMALQVTLFPDQGIALGFTNHHVIADECSFVGFVKAWSSRNNMLFGGNNDSELMVDIQNILPSYERTTVEDPEGLDSMSWNNVKKKLFHRLVERSHHHLPRMFSLNKVRATFIITKQDVKQLKNLVLSKRAKVVKHLSAFTVICAHLWASMAKSEALVADDEPEYFSFAADCRARLTPPLPSNYFGNCVIFIVTKLMHSQLKGSEGFLTAAQAIGDAIWTTLYGNEKGVLDGNWPINFERYSGTRIVSVAGSPRFDIYDADYGWGRPTKYEFVHLDKERSVSLVKSREIAGGFEIGLSRTVPEMEAFGSVFNEDLGKLRD